jgi:sodium transport system permease protein
MNVTRGAWIVLKKELRDHLRDRRSLLTALLLPLFGPAMLFGVFRLTASWTNREKPLRIPAVGAEQAPNLVAFLQRYRAEVVPAPADYEAQVRDGKLDLALVVSKDYGKDFAAGRTATLQLVVDNSRNKSRATIQRARRLLQEYSRQMGAMRLVARGVNPELARALNVEDLDLATAEKTAAMVLGMLPVFILMAVLMGGVNVAIDATAGERERGSLEPLLLNPVPAADIVLGKWLTAALVSLMALAVNLAGSKLAVARVPLQDLGLRAHLGAPEIAGIVLAVLPLALLAPAVQMLLAVFSRSYKEAQTYLNLIMLVPIIPGFIASLSPFKHELWMMLIPSLAQTLLMEQVMRGETPSVLWFALAWAGCLACAAFCVALMVRLLASERIIFGR